MSDYLNKLFDHENFPIHIMLGESLYDQFQDENNELDTEWLGDISKIHMNGEAVAFEIKGKPYYFIDKYKYSSLSGKVHNFDEFKAVNIDELLLSITMYTRLKKGYDFKGVTLEYESLSLDTHEDILIHIKSLGYNVVDELVRVQDTRNNSTSSKSKFTVYF